MTMFPTRIALAALLIAAGLAGCEQQAPPATDGADDAGAAMESPATPGGESQGAAGALSLEDVEAAVELEETEGLPAPAEAAEGIRLPGSRPAAATASTQEWQYREGAHFRRMPASQGTSSPPDKIEVAEVFWYGCSHCYNFDPIIDAWKKQLAPDVSFVRIPVIWNPTNQVHARIMYTAEALDVLDEVHAAVFQAIHQDGNMLTREEDIVKLFARFGVDEARFREAYNSFSVNSAVKRAENLTRRYGVRSVPVIVVNGKYATDAPEIRSFDDMLGVTAELVQRERQER